MDNVLNKLRSTLISTVGSTAHVVSQVHAALPGNNVTKEYEAVKHIASAGPGFLWKIYSGFKKSTKQEAAIFIFEKKLLERYPKMCREQLLDSLRKGVKEVTRLRHPNILVVQHPLDESRDALAFATEPVFASLGNILGFRENGPEPGQWGRVEGFKLDELEVKYGLVQLCEGLGFLHRDVKLVHRNVGVESVVINAAGAWKLFGFDFCQANESPEGTEPFWRMIEYASHLPPHCQPHMDYMAPEYAKNARVGPWSDMYSVGVLAYALFNNGKPLFRNGDNFEIFRTNAGELDHLTMSNLSCIPNGLRDMAKMLLSANPDIRPEAGQVGESAYFQDVGVKTLSYLDAMYQWDNVQKTQFYKGLQQVLPRLPFRVRLLRVVPCLAKEFVNPPMVPFVLGPVLAIAEEASAEEFREYILPGLKPVLRIAEPVQITLIFLQRMDLLVSKTPAGDVREYVLPVIYRAIESKDPEVQSLGLSVVPKAAPLVDYPALKNALLPKIKTLCLETKILKTRVLCLLTIGKILENLDRWLVMDEVLPFLPKIPSREPAVVMGILGIYKLTLDGNKLGISKDVLATQVLPFLFPMCVESGLTLQQFDNVMGVVREMIDRVEADMRPKVEQLDQMRKEQKSAFDATLEAGAGISKPSIEWPEAGDSSCSSDFFSPRQNGSVNGRALPATAEEMKAIEWHDAVPASASADSKPKPSHKHLSLEEKQRLAKAMESGSQPTVVEPGPPPRMTPSATFPSYSPAPSYSSPNQSTLSGSGGWSSTSTTPKTTSRDLTSSLMSGNVNSLGRPQQLLQQQQPPQQFTASFPSQPLGVVGGGFLSPFGQVCLPPPPTATATATATATVQQPNARAFDDLLPMTNAPKVSMNQMMARAAHAAPTLTPTVSFNAPKPAVNSLSSKDIDELLR